MRSSAFIFIIEYTHLGTKYLVEGIGSHREINDLVISKQGTVKFLREIQQSGMDRLLDDSDHLRHFKLSHTAQAF